MGGEQPRWTTCSHDGCIGRRLPTAALCLAHAAEEAPDVFDAELKRIGEEGTVDLRGVTINAELLNRLLAAAPQEDNRPTFAAAQFHRATFQDAAWFSEATFHGTAVFDEATFEDDAGFTEATFHGTAGFVKANFHAEAKFDGATFHRMAWFAEAAFQGEVGFDEVTFQDHAEFFQATFHSWTMFAGATFQDHAGFFDATFHATIDFTEAAFQGEAGFAGVAFQGKADFEGAAFHGEAAFKEATFQRGAGFAGVTFQGRAGFDEATFQRRADFDGASFQDLAWFGGVSFWGQAWFHRARFERATQLGPLLARQLVLDGAVFGARVQLQVAAAVVCARRAHFPAGVHLRLRYATVDLDDADLAAPAILAGVPSSFPTLKDHEQNATRSWERLPPGPRAQRWRPRLLSARRADVAGLRLADVDLRACRFAGAHNLDRLRIEGAPLFARTPGWWRARRKALAEEQHWRAARPGRWRKAGWYPKRVGRRRPPGSKRRRLWRRRGWRRCTGSCARAARTPRTSPARPTSTTANARCAATTRIHRWPNGSCCGCTG
jgi:uncharacterized protein YjbI with pentapeptide repeats